MHIDRLRLQVARAAPSVHHADRCRQPAQTRRAAHLLKSIFMRLNHLHNPAAPLQPACHDHRRLPWRPFGSITCGVDDWFIVLSSLSAAARGTVTDQLRRSLMLWWIDDQQRRQPKLCMCATRSVLVRCPWLSSSPLLDWSCVLDWPNFLLGADVCLRS
jgi:hypothetical protein